MRENTPKQLGLLPQLASARSQGGNFKGLAAILPRLFGLSGLCLRLGSFGHGETV